jgi:hypothetical protein
MICTSQLKLSISKKSVGPLTDRDKSKNRIMYLKTGIIIALSKKGFGFVLGLLFKCVLI